MQNVAKYNIDSPVCMIVKMHCEIQSHQVSWSVYNKKLLKNINSAGQNYNHEESSSSKIKIKTDKYASKIKKVKKNW